MLSKDKKPKILILDIETINLRANLSPILCVGYKWHGEKKIECPAIWDYESYDSNKDFYKIDKELCKDLRKVLDEADALVCHYIKFDARFINSRFLLHGIPPIKGIPLIDTWRLMKDNLALTSNRLKQGCSFFEVKNQKDDSGGWTTWLNVMRDNPAAQRKMVKYCKQDVRALEDLFTVLKPFTNKIPNHNLALETAETICHNCGSGRVKSHGWYGTPVNRYRKYRCRDCNSVGRYDKKGKNPRGV